MSRSGIYPADAVIMAPLSGFTDAAYRRSLYRHGCKFAFTEMVDVSAMAYKTQSSFFMLERSKEDVFLGCQLVGSSVEHTKIAMQELKAYDFDLIDLNLGCPVPKVAKKGAGAALGRNFELAKAVFSVIAENAKCPVTAKIRIVDADNVEPTLELVKMLENCGASAITIHGRIKEAFYSGPVNFEQIRICRENLKIPVIANGGIMNFDNYLEIKEKTKCTQVMTARGAMGNPWLFEELQTPENFHRPDVFELAEEIRLHIIDTCLLYGENHGMKLSRKLVHDYLKGRGFRSSYRAEASQMYEISDLYALLKKLCAEYGNQP
ncbi:MAG: tRNA-dihydrouridine synthase family protein [Lentisphaeria bacterium]|nr:tRNA-dihydrouridine synthase family protein [Lentisphaeria bacterium]